MIKILANIREKSPTDSIKMYTLRGGRGEEKHVKKTVHPYEGVQMTDSRNQKRHHKGRGGGGGRGKGGWRRANTVA